MEEKILNILLGIQKNVSDLKEDISGLKQDVTVLKEDVSELKRDVAILKEDNKHIKGEIRIMKNNIAKILKVQNEMNVNFKKHEREAKIKYKEMDYRLTRLEA